MTSQAGPSGSKAPNIAVFSSEVSTALETTQELQDNVHKLLHMFTEWNSHESEESLVRVKEKIKDIQSCQSKIEKISAAFPKFPETKPVALGNAGLISLDPGEDKSTVYQDILDAYSWVKKLNCDASNALKSLKRKYPEPEVFPFKTKKDDNMFLLKLLPVLQGQNPDVIISIGDKRVPCLKVIIKGFLDTFKIHCLQKGNKQLPGCTSEILFSCSLQSSCQRLCEMVIILQRTVH